LTHRNTSDSKRAVKNSIILRLQAVFYIIYRAWLFLCADVSVVRVCGNENKLKNIKINDKNTTFLLNIRKKSLTLVKKYVII
jgi:hypothetical protein